MDRAALDLVLSDLAGTPHGERTAAVERAAALYAVSKATLYRRLAALGHGGPKRPRDPARPELRAWAETLIQLASKAPGRTIPLDLALRAAVREGLLPAEAGEVDIGTYNRVLREGGYRQTQRRTRRISAEWPMQGVQFDASTSAHLVVVKSLSDGDALLRLFRDPMPASGYKNKPLGPERLRVVYYGLWDVCTGLRHMRATAARGEAGIPAMEYLVGAFEGGGDPRQPFQGLPDDLWSDQGPIVKHDATRDLLERMGINVLTGAPYQKTRQGGIESGWRTAWGRFEESLFMLQVGRSKVELTLSDLNEQLGEFLAELNSKPSRNQIALSRRDAYVQGCNRRGGIRQCPQDALGTLAKECRRTLDSSGIFRLGNREYEVPRLHSCQVIVRHALDDSERVIVEHPQTGERYDARPWQASGYGDFHADPGFERAELPIDQARAAGAEVAIRQPIFSPGAEPVPSNVRAFPARSQPAEPLSDPLDAGRHTDLPAAMAHFCALYPYPLSPRNRELIEARFLADGLRKSTVSEVAAALTHLAKGEAHTVT